MDFERTYLIVYCKRAQFYR